MESNNEITLEVAEDMETQGVILEDMIESFKLSEFRIEYFTESEESFEEKMRKYVAMRKEKEKKGKLESNESLMEILQQLDHSDEEMAFDLMSAIAADLGIKMSQLLVEYFLLFPESHSSEVARNLRLFEEMIRSESAEDRSMVIIDRFIAVIEYVDKEMSAAPRRNYNTEGNSSTRMENGLVCKIFLEVLNLESVFVVPFFPMVLVFKDLYFLAGNIIIESFESELKKISSEINQLTMEFESIRGYDSKNIEFEGINGEKSLMAMVDFEDPKTNDFQLC
ncbi:hypothetical protein PanWU01x14_348210 [Parasponia andersonii]|uniref:Uncharacterized protein n=1 Tax=Parasponia andersonii TaxID=3476 RepID=A0A2P5ABR7_PARAD|nr:hypothetical protein PanWU01x14_348210 [Parasponia andersonii]